MDPVRAHVAILSVLGSSVRTEVAIENIIADALTGAGHEVTSFEAVRDSEVAIRSQLVGWIEDPDVDMIIIVGEGQATTRALNPLVDERLPGFADLLRMVAFQAVGAGAMLSSPEAARCGQTFVFVLPAGEKAARAAMEKLILPQLDPATTPHNLVDKLPRLREDGDVTRVDHASGPAESIPVPVPSEKTATGRPFPLRPPAKPAAPAGPRAKNKTNQNILRPAKIEDPTKPIELVKLEEQIELSKPIPTSETKPVEKLEPAPPPVGAVGLREDVASDRPAPGSPPGGRRAAVPDGDRTKPLDLSASSAPIPKVFPPVGRETPKGVTAVSATVTTPLQPSVNEWAAEPDRVSPSRSGQMPVVRAPEPTPASTPTAPPARPTPMPMPSVAPPARPSSEPPARPTPLPSLAPPTRPTPVPATLPSITGKPPATLPKLEPAVRTTAIQNTVVTAPEPSLEEAPTVPAPRGAGPPVASSIIGRPKQPTPAPPVVVIPPRGEAPPARTRQPTPPVPTKVVIPPRDEAPRPRRPTPPVPTTMITTPPPAPRPRALTPPVPTAAMRPRAQTPPVPMTAVKVVAGLPKLPPGASGEFLESDLLESADDLPAVTARPVTEEVEEIIELAPPPKPPEPKPEPKPEPVLEPKAPVLPAPRPAATPVAAAIEPVLPRPPDVRTRSGTAPVDPLPHGTFSYPEGKRRSKLPLVIALLLLAMLAGAAIVLLTNRTKDKREDTTVARGSAPASAADAAEVVAALDAGLPADPDAAEVEVVMEPPDAAVATQKPPRPPKPPVTPRDAGPRVATNPVDAAPRQPDVPTPPVDAAVAVVAPPPDAAPPPVVVAEGCDETTCVMENYAKPCCARWKPNSAGNFGQTLEKSQIRAGIATVKPAIVACGEKASTKGTVTVAVVVSPDGVVTGVSVASSPDGALGACVAAAVRRASFAKTAKGGSFNYPFVF